jgi:DNA-binding SARP family transcriptional activator
MSEGRVGIRVLGPLQAELAGAPLDLGGPRQRAVLALLLVARREVVSVDRLIEDLWAGEPPPRAIGALQSYVSNLRRALEPGRAPRSPASVLVSAAPGYAVRLDDDAVDAWRFEALVRAAAGAPPALARAHLRAGLDLWGGAALAEFADESWAAPEAARLQELRVTAREQLAAASVADGAPADAVPLAEALTREHPLREEGWRLLALGLYAAGRQGEALAALRRARRTLSDELGLDPGPALAALEADVRAQRVVLPVGGDAGTPAVRGAMATAEQESHPTTPREQGAPRRFGDAEMRDEVTDLDVPEPTRKGAPALARQMYVGREVELSAAHETAAAARRGTLQVLLVAGEAGAGKSAFLEQLRSRLEPAGWVSAWGCCPEVDGAPPAWPWAEVLRRLAADLPGDDPRVADLAPLLADRADGAADVAAGRFRLHRAAAGVLTHLRPPLLLMLDDLHRADEETLAMLTSMVGQLGGREGVEVLLVGAYRPGEAGDGLEDALATLARHSPVRLALGGLGRDDAARFVHQVAGVDLDAATLDRLTERTGGNPFYLRESARLLASEGELVALSEVPQGVRDVLRRRVARLPELAVAVLRLAAVAGREVDVDVLVEAAEVGEEDVVTGLETGVLSGLLTEPETGRVRFAHVLIQETLLGDLPRLRRSRWHARLAAAIEKVQPERYSELAHHYAQAGTAATAARAVETSTRAGELATARYAHAAAARLHRQALASLDRLPDQPARLDERIAVYCRLVPALIWSGNARGANAAQDEALDLVEAAGRDDLAARFLAACDEPMPWLTRGYADPDRRLAAVLHRLLARDDLDASQRCSLLCVLVEEMGPHDPAGLRPAAEQAVVLARQLDDPVRLATALSVKGFVVAADLEPAVKDDVAAELEDLSERHDLPTSRLLAEFYRMGTDLTRGDLAALRDRVERVGVLAERHQMIQALDTVGMVRSMLLHVAGRLAEAEDGYLATTASIDAHGSLDAAAMRGLALFTLRLTSGRVAELVPVLERMSAEFGPLVADLHVVALAAAGDRARAAAVYRTGIEPRRDFFHVLLTTMRGMATVAVGAVDDAAAVRAGLLPHAGQVAGAATASFVAGPVAHVLGDLDLLLGDVEAARAHYRQALDLCTRLEAPLWAASATAALARLPATPERY